jgi:hypothetical protein
MRRWTLAAALAALFGAALWHLPATAQRSAPPQNPEPALAQPAFAQPAAAQSAAAQSAAAETALEHPAARPVAPQLITFDEYRDFRMHDIAQRQARLTRELSEPNLTATQKASLAARKAYYDRLTAMPADQRDRLFRARFDEIDANHDGMIDEAERAAWREKQREHYRELAAARAAAHGGQQ